jgi:ribose 5-phosphate isomerase B
MRIVIGSDHAGFELKEQVKKEIARLGHTVIDAGAFTEDPEDDYPDFAKAVGDVLIAGGADRGVLICGSGVGVSVAANKMPGIRAAMCHDTYSAHQGVEHDDMNCLVLGSRIIGSSLAFELVQTYLNARYQSEQPRFVRRLNKVLAIEAEYMPEAAKLRRS